MIVKKIATLAIASVGVTGAAVSIAYATSGGQVEKVKELKKAEQHSKHPIKSGCSSIFITACW